jgi:hypothetical protein
MSAVKTISALFLALVLSFTLVGCVVGLPQEEVDQIIANVTSAEYDTVKFDVEMPATIRVVGGSEPGTMTMMVDGTGVIDMANEEMQVTMNMTMDIPGEGEQEMAMEVYIVGEWIYTMMALPNLGEQWTKMEVTEEMWQQQSQIEPLLEFLATAVEVNYLGSKTLSGTECYLFEIVPDMEALGELLGQETAGTGLDFSQLDLADIYKELSVKEWIAKDSYLLVKVEIGMVLEMSPSDVGATADDFEEMTMDVKLAESFYDYNEPVSIELPQEALDAEEISY